MQHGLNDPIVSTFVDDIKMMGRKESRIIEKIKREFITAFKIVDMRPISFYLGLKIKQNQEKRIIKLS